MLSGTKPQMKSVNDFIQAKSVLLTSLEAYGRWNRFHMSVNIQWQ